MLPRTAAKLLLLLGSVLSLLQNTSASSPEHVRDWTKCTKSPCETQLRDPHRGWIDDALVHIDDFWWQLKSTLRTVTERTGELANDALDAVWKRDLHTVIPNTMTNLRKRLSDIYVTVTKRSGEFAQVAMDAVECSERRRELFKGISKSVTDQLHEMYEHPWVAKTIIFMNRCSQCVRRTAEKLREAAGDLRDIFVEEFEDSW